METDEEISCFSNRESDIANTSQNKMIEDSSEEGYYSKQESARSTFSPHSDTNEQLHMAEFQRAIDRLRLRRQSSSSSQGIQAQEGSRKNSVVRDLLQGQKSKVTTNFSSTCTSPAETNGKILLYSRHYFYFIIVILSYVLYNDLTISRCIGTFSTKCNCRG